MTSAPVCRLASLLLAVASCLCVPAAAAARPAAQSPAPQPQDPGLRTDADGTVYAVAAVPQPGRYDDPLRLYQLRFPADWRLLRAIDGGHVACTVTPDAGELAPSRLRVGVQVMSLRLSEQIGRQRLPATGLLQLLLPNKLREHPGMRLVAGVSAARLGGLDAAVCTIAGRREGQAEDTASTYLLAEQDGQVFQLHCFSPQDQSAALQQTFDAIAADSRFGRLGLPRLDTSIEARKLVQKYKGSIVSVTASSAQGGSYGTGFLISRDGYVLTNYHVAFDVASRTPRQRFTVDWDESLRRQSVAAELVGGRFELSPFQHQHGTDVALLKIPPGDYQPLPLSPLADVEAGDGVVTLGFPSRTMLEGLSLTVTTGVVSRFNRRPSGEVESVFVDATFTHGSSGGPCLSLVTGGAIGLTTFGTDVQLNPQQQGLNDLINYKGVVPIDKALREFPLQCLTGVGQQVSGLDFLDCIALSKHWLSTGSLAAAQQLAQRSVALAPQQAWAHLRLGECCASRGSEQQAAGDRDGAAASFAAARAAFEQALQRDRNHAAALAAYAGMQQQLGEADQARALAARAIQSDAKNWQAHLLLAEIALRAQRYDEALQHVARAKQVAGGVIVNPHVTAAWIHTARGDLDQARAEWAEAARISPVYLPARLGVAAGYENAGRIDDALAEYQRVLADFRDDAEVQGRIASCLLRQGRLDQAMPWFQRSVQRSADTHQPPDEQLLLQCADALLGNGRDVDAISVLALHLFHCINGPMAPHSSLRLAAIHAQHQAHGLASAHARLALALDRDGALRQQGQQFAPAALSLQEIKFMLQFRYPLPLLADLVANAPLAFTVQGAEQLQQLQAEGLPPMVLQAIADSLGRQPPQPGAAPAGNICGTWTADGQLADGRPFRCLLLFGDQGVFTADTFVGGGSLGPLRGTFLCDGRQVVLRPQGGPEFVSAIQLQGDVLVMDMPGFAPGIRFSRQP